MAPGITLASINKTDTFNGVTTRQSLSQRLAETFFQAICRGAVTSQQPDLISDCLVVQQQEANYRGAPEPRNHERAESMFKLFDGICACVSSQASGPRRMLVHDRLSPQWRTTFHSSHRRLGVRVLMVAGLAHVNNLANVSEAKHHLQDLHPTIHP